MWGAIASAAMSIASGIASAVQNKKTRQQQRENLERDWREYNSTANRLRNRSLKDSESYQYGMSRIGEELQEENKQADAMVATGAASQEQAAAIKENNNKTLLKAEGEHLSNFENERRFDENMLSNEKKNLQAREDAIDNQKIADRAAATQQFMGAASSLGSALDNIGSKGSEGGKSGSGTTVDDSEDFDPETGEKFTSKKENAPTGTQIGSTNTVLNGGPEAVVIKGLSNARRQQQAANKTSNIDYSKAGAGVMYNNVTSNYNPNILTSRERQVLSHWNKGEAKQEDLNWISSNKKRWEEIKNMKGSYNTGLGVNTDNVKYNYYDNYYDNYTI